MCLLSGLASQELASEMADEKCWYTLDAASQPVGPYSIADLTGKQIVVQVAADAVMRVRTVASHPAINMCRLCQLRLRAGDPAILERGQDIMGQVSRGAGTCFCAEGSEGIQTSCSSCWVSRDSAVGMSQLADLRLPKLICLPLIAVSASFDVGRRHICLTCLQGS